MKIKTATVTWIHYKNYGTYLQAYALQKVILKLGYENRIINDIKIARKTTNVPYFFSILLIVFKSFFSSFYRLKLKSWIKFHYFKKENLLIDSNFTKNKNQYDVYIAGSDQIWAPKTYGIEPFYFINFTNKKKISYAPSLGRGKYTECLKIQIKDLLKDFEFISVRENEGRNLLKSFLDKDIYTVLDPTLLLTTEDLKEILIPQQKFKNFYLCYLLSYNKQYLDAIKNICIKNKKKLLMFPTFKECYNYADILVPAGPAEFLSYIYNADYIFTDSFHGTIFSLIFEKQFMSLKRFPDSHISNQNSRLTNLLDIVKLSSRFKSEKQLDSLLDLDPINYEKVKQIIQIEQQKSIDFLKNALNNDSNM